MPCRFPRAHWLFFLFGLLALPAGAAPRPLEVRFFDVGQGDAALIRSPTGKTVLIDGGPPESSARLVEKVSRATGGQPLDLVILTHAHLDHLGGLGAVLRAVGAKRYMDPGIDHPSRAYADLLDVVRERTGQVLVPQPRTDEPGRPLTVGLGEGAELQILWPRAPTEPLLVNTRSDVNANSIVARLTYGKTSFLFVGDSEADTETRMLRQWRNFEADVLKVAHHGSRHSSQQSFLEAVHPQFAVISCGAGNDYGHPGRETLARLAEAGAKVFRTDLQGDIVAQSDGRSVTLRPARGEGCVVESRGALKALQAASEQAPVLAHSPEPQPTHVATSKAAAAPSSPAYVASRQSKVFHKPGCSAIQEMKPENRLFFPNREAASASHRPAKDCNP